MMTITIRLANPETDYLYIAELLTLVEQTPTTVERLREWDRHSPTGQIRRRSVAVDDQGQLVGYSVVFHEASDTTGRFKVWVTVDPAHRRRGIGNLLYQQGLQFAQEQGAKMIESEVLEQDKEALRFAQKRSFAIHQHVFESTLDLATFDERPFAGFVEAVEATGIRFFSLADVGNTEAAQRKLYAVNYATALDDPGSGGVFPSFEEFRQILTTSSWFRAEGQILAADGDEYVGLSAVGYFEETHSMYNMMTGVLPAYRGRKIAQALKLLSIRFAKAYGAAYIRTHNDSLNGPMLAINRKLGYQPQLGIYRLRTRLV